LATKSNSEKLSRLEIQTAKYLFISETTFIIVGTKMIEKDELVIILVSFGIIILIIISDYATNGLIMHALEKALIGFINGTAFNNTKVAYGGNISLGFPSFST
jgi:hypothetical protein